MSATNAAVKFDDMPEEVGPEDMCLGQLFDAVVTLRPANVIVYNSHGDLTICFNDTKTVEPLAMRNEQGEIIVMPPSNQSLQRIADVTEKMTRILMPAPAATPA